MWHTFFWAGAARANITSALLHTMAAEQNTAEGVARAAAARLAAAAGVARYRNGRLDIDWFSRSLRPRWRMVRLNGQWYDRDGVRGLAAVPATRRRLTAAELAHVRDPAPWSLAPPPDDDPAPPRTPPA